MFEVVIFHVIRVLWETAVKCVGDDDDDGPTLPRKTLQGEVSNLNISSQINPLTPLIDNSMCTLSLWS
jgi:hypothetical protein